MTTSYPTYFTRRDLRRMSETEREVTVSALLAAMSQEEKRSLLGGGIEPEEKGKTGNAGYLPGVPRLGIPELVMYDGPAGITGVVETTGFPQPCLLGCTWDDELAYDFGKAAAEECAACGGNVLLAPQADVIRSPHFYRNKDMKSEDAFQCARMGAAETRGVQAAGVIATVKHFAAANLFGEDLAHFPEQRLDEQTLHESYCRPFDAAIHEGGAGFVMNAYNRLNGGFVSENRALLQGILREQWGFRGAVMSDWGSVHRFTLDRGVDMEMPFPAYNSPRQIEKRLLRGEITQEIIDEAARHVLWAYASAGLLGLVQLDEEGRPLEEPGRTAPIQMLWHYEQSVQAGLFRRHAALAAQIAREGIVLLKNERQALPFPADEAITLIGLGAKVPLCGEAQERSFGTLSRMCSGQQALEETLGRPIPGYAGIDYLGEPIPAAAFYQDAACTKPGLIRTYGILPEDRDPMGLSSAAGGGGGAFEGQRLVDEDGDPIDTGLDSYNARKEETGIHPTGSFCQVDHRIDFAAEGTGYLGGTALSDGESYTWKGYLQAPEDGDCDLILQAIGGQVSFFIRTEDGWRRPGQSQMREWAQWPWESLFCTPEGMGVTSERIALKAGTAYPILVHARPCVKNKDLQLRLAWTTPAFRRRTYAEALRAAMVADTIVFFACDTHAGFQAGLRRLEEQRLRLHAEQEQLLLDVIAARREEAKLVVVLQTANARNIGRWEPMADAIVTTYLPGQEGNRVLAEILTGKINPSGKLSQSWPRREEDTPLTDTEEHLRERMNGENGVVTMSEGIFTGYRWHDQSGISALYPFGHGLSYTDFSYSNLVIEGLTVSFTVKNRGTRVGDEIVQLYLGAAKAPTHIQMAEKQLAGYCRLAGLQPGEERSCRMTIPPEMLCYWDDRAPLRSRPDGTKDKWIRAVGIRKVYVAASSTDIRLEGEIIVPQDDQMKKDSSEQRLECEP